MENLKITKKHKFNTSVCGVPQCLTYRGKNVSMHSIPQEVLASPVEKQKWIDVLKINKNIPTHFRMCHLHFAQKDLLCPIKREGVRTRVHLSKNAFPCRNLPKTNIINGKGIKTINLNEEYVELDDHGENYSIIKKTKIGEENQILVLDNSSYNPTSKHENVEMTKSELYVDDNGCSKENLKSCASKENETNYDEDFEVFELPPACVENLDTIGVHSTKNNKKHGEYEIFETKDISTQANLVGKFNNVQVGIFDYLRTEKELECWTGIRSFESLNNIVMYLNILKSNELDMFDLPVEELIVLLMVRIRTNLSFLRMSTLFRLDEESVLKYFEIFLPLLKSVLPAVSLQKQDSNLSLVVEPLEISVDDEIQGNFIIKALIAFTTSGVIICASEFYAETVSYDHICIKEGLYDKFKQMNTIIAGYKLGLKQEIESRGMIYCPPDTYIDKIRVNVMENIKAFEYFQHPIKNSGISYVDDILSVICSVININ